MTQEAQKQQEFGAYIGLDWADRTHVISLRSADHNRVEHYELAHKPEALAEWVSGLIEEAMAQKSPSPPGRGLG